MPRLTGLFCLIASLAFALAAIKVMSEQATVRPKRSAEIRDFPIGRALVNNGSKFIVEPAIVENAVSGALVNNGSKYAPITDLGVLPDAANSQLPTINDAGQLVAMPQGEASWFRDFLWAKGGFDNSKAAFINTAGQVVGMAATADGKRHAHLWQNGSMRDLGTLPGFIKSLAFGINDSAQVVGRLEDKQGNRCAFVWQDGTMVRLDRLIDPALGWLLETAYVIDDSAQVAGVGKLNGQHRAFLLTLPR